ncbi:MAG TPA: hypothetical protein VK338_02475 [Candidatus Nitrosocosmicus sp.]|nr:hypothetical protein [Candidatus Nitrosocosmicus sp.]
MKKKIRVQTASTSLERHILHVVKYFTQFQYPPTLEEIWMFLPIKISKKALNSELKHLIKVKKIIEKEVQVSAFAFLDQYLTSKISAFIRNFVRYTLRGYSTYFDVYADRTVYAENKWNIAIKYTSVIKYVPWVLMVGISGSLSMLNTSQKDDVDLCIITRKNRLWLGRFSTSLIASIMGIRRKRGDKHVNNKICLNLYFDAKELYIPDHKHTEYIAHEVLQLKPIIDKNLAYENFLKVNKWVFDFFPNAKKSITNYGLRITNQNIINCHAELDSVSRGFKMRSLSPQGTIHFVGSQFGMTWVGDIIEILLKHLQLFLINRHRTTEIITDTQLWFYPHDYEKKLKK